MGMTAPTASFTIPSIYDDTDLECRIFHPRRFFNHRDTRWQKKGAVIAHPYAPLGGCLDDPIVQTAKEEALRQGFVVGLFNFRGAGESKGRTSWSAKPEHQDYISFVGFLIYYLQELSPIAPVSISSPTSSMDRRLSPIPSSADPSSVPETTLLLGGYSYGSLITLSLPPIEAILPIFAHVVKGSAHAEIRLRARHLSQQWNTKMQSQTKHRGRTLAAGTPHVSSTAVYGGEESEPGTRRASRESRKSIDVVRRSMDRSHARLSIKTRSSYDHSQSSVSEEHLVPIEISLPNTIYLLISPLLPPISSLVTMFTKKWPYMAENGMPQLFHTIKDLDSPTIGDKLWAHPSLAIFGDKDFFTSCRKLRKWAEQLVDRPDSRFSFSEISGAGHFWNENGSELTLKTTIRNWLGDTKDA